MSVPPWRAKTAYTAVSSGQALSRKPQPAQPSREKTHWPEPLKRFVTRCFETVDTDDREEMEKQLKQTITAAFEANKTWELDWDSQTLPILEQAKEKARKTKTQQAKTPKTKTQETEKRPIYEDFNKLTTAEQNLKRQRRFQTPSSYPSTDSTNTPAPVDPTEPIVGRCTVLEKKYLRLTSAPDPDFVRPLDILKQTLELLKKKWRNDQNYAYICDQFKSLRQDLTVQHIENAFTVSVYEIHARIALEKADLGEYNQCQSRLKELYDKGIPGHEREFLAYRILYLLHTHNRAEIGRLLSLLSNDVLNDPAVNHALGVNTAMTRRDYHSLFRLYVDAPNMGGYVMDSFVSRERLSGLAAICRSYRPDISVQFVTRQLGFLDSKECVEFLVEFELGEYIVDESTKMLLQTKDAFTKVEMARQRAFKKIDIKGQI